MSEVPLHGWTAVGAVCDLNFEKPLYAFSEREAQLIRYITVYIVVLGGLM